MKLGSNITFKNVLQVYVTTTAICYAISLIKVRTSHALTGAGENTIDRYMLNASYSLTNHAEFGKVYLH